MAGRDELKTHKNFLNTENNMFDRDILLMASSIYGFLPDDLVQFPKLALS